MIVDHGNARRGPAIGWMMLYHLPDRVTDADFEVIEPTKEQHGNDESAGDGTNTGSPSFPDSTTGITGTPCAEG